jgi:hypothetical protein
LRSKVLALQPDELPSLLEPSSPLIGILTETGHDKAVATLVTIADGTTSMYFSNGGAIIGLGEHDEPRMTCLEYLSFANQFISRMKPVSEFPLPSKGYTTFYVVTKNGVFSTTAKENDLGKNLSPLSPLFYKAHEVITQARLTEEEIRRNALEFIQAATDGDESKIMEFLAKDRDPNTPDPDGRSPLMAAAYSNQARILVLLLDKEIVIDQKDSSGYTALMYACNSGSLDCARLLVQHGADIHQTANDGSTPIMFASQHGHNDIVQLLLSNGADPNQEGAHGLSAIGFAKQNNLQETLNILLGKT